MSHASASPLRAHLLRIGIALTVLCLLNPLALLGCSRVEDVLIINHYSQPIKIVLHGENTFPIIPAQGQEYLDQEFYLGGGSVPVTVLDTEGHVLKKADIDVPGDSECRSAARIEIFP